LHAAPDIVFLGQPPNPVYQPLTFDNGTTYDSLHSYWAPSYSSSPSVMARLRWVLGDSPADDKVSVIRRRSGTTDSLPGSLRTAANPYTLIRDLGMSSKGVSSGYHGGSKNPDQKKVNKYLSELDELFPEENPSPVPPPNNKKKSEQKPNPRAPTPTTKT
jgi:hypothetical protein